MSTDVPGIGVEEGVRSLLLLMPRVVGRAKKMRVPEELQSFSLAPRHLSLLANLVFEGPMTVNDLAARLEDGQQVIVPVRGTGGAAPAAPSGAGAPPGAAGAPKPSLAAATIEQLDQIDGIGPTLAQRILEYRTQHGGFRSLAELREVDGIGEKRFAGLRKALQP